MVRLIFVPFLFLVLPGVLAVTLLNGRFETTSDVQYLLDLGLDAAAMREATTMAAKAAIYQNGTQSEYGNFSVPKVTLQSLSLTAKDEMQNSPMFNIFRHAFFDLGSSQEGETEGTFDNAPVEAYGDTLVNDLLSLNIDDIETEAALVTSVWMAAVDQLFRMLQHCKDSNITEGLAALDKFAALWIGEGQDEGSNEYGHLLYNLAENAGERFEQDDGETMVNTQLINLLVTMQTNLTTVACQTDNGIRNMRGYVKQSIGLMTIPLVQNLIHHTMNVQNEGGSNFVELYALATMPRVAPCAPVVFDNLLQLLVLNELQPSQADMAINAIQEAYNCLGITCTQVGTYLGGTVPQCDDERTVVAAGYASGGESARQKLNLDRDIKAIDIFLRFEAYQAAQDWYQYGWNSNALSLQDLAQNRVIPAWSESSYISIFQKYYNDENFADNLMTSVFQRVSPFDNTDKEQLRNLATGVLKYVVMFMISASSLQYAVDQCNVNQITAIDHWDTGALLYMGSMEGAASYGQPYGGELLFSTAKRLCADFDTCISQSIDDNGVAIAAANHVMIEGFKKGLLAIKGGSCDVAKGILENQILPTIAIPLIQGTIKYASYNADLEPGTSNPSVAVGDTFARGIVPIVAQSSPDSASTIMNNMKFQVTTQPVPEGFQSVANAFRSAIGGMSTSCVAVGEFVHQSMDGGLCPSRDASDNTQSPSLSNQIAFGRYVFQDLQAVDGESSLALDVRDMFQAASVEEARRIYYNGTNALSAGLFGSFNGTSLASLSQDATRYMGEDPMFNIYRYALYDDRDFEEKSGEDFLYADEVVAEALDSAEDSKLAAEAAVVMNVWMVIVHRLYASVRLCDEHEDPIPSIDSAVALWIGKEQQEGKFDQGWMLYSVAQAAFQFFGMPEGEAPVNTRLMELFNAAQAAAKTCSLSASKSDDLYFVVRELIRTLSKPLIFTMLYHLVSGSNNMIEMYAVSVIPQAMACDENIGRSLQNVLFNGFSRDSLTDDFLDHLAIFLRCQRITTEDLRYNSTADLKFRNLLNTLSSKLEYRGFMMTHFNLAGYRSNTDLLELARLDMDVLEIKILMRTKAYMAAQEIYRRGHNSYDNIKEARYLSLESFSKRNSFVSSLPQEVIDQYYQTKFVSNEILEMAFSQSGDFSGATRRQLTELVTRTIQTMVSFDAIFNRIHLARKSCSGVKNLQEGFGNAMTTAVRQWDEAVALFVGSIEGSLAGGRPGGFFLYSLANQACSQFGVCEASGESSINEEILINLSAGRDAIHDGNCNSLDRIVNGKLTPSFLTILIQGTISAIMELQKKNDSYNTALATTYVLSKTLVPFVNQTNSTSSSVMESAFGKFSAITNKQTPLLIVEALAYSLRGLGIDCSDVGTPVNNPHLGLCLQSDDDEEEMGNVPGEGPVPETPTNLGNGSYITSTYVQDRANIAKDIIDLQSALESNSHKMAQMIYQEGKNSKVFDENGKFQSLRSLQSFSTQETKEMVDEPLFNLFAYTLQSDADGTFLSHDIRLYADSLVNEAFKNLTTSTRLLPVEAILVLNLWMYIAHLLYKTLKDCKDSKLVADDGIQSLDIAVAYWIGDGQYPGSGDRGHLLYAMTERMAEIFNIDISGHSRTNANILKLFNEAKHDISLPGACSDNQPGSILRLSRLVNQITSLMAVPLIQSLIHNLYMDDRPRVRLYAHSVVPLMAGCNPAVFNFLKQKLLDPNYDAMEIDDIVSHIQSTYDCLGLSCDAIGVHKTENNDVSKQCNDPAELSFLAGYKFKYPIHDIARIDLDLREMDILLGMKAYDAAENLYTFGKHARGATDGNPLSLFQLATTRDRELVPQYDAFLRYYSNSFDTPRLYADSIIRSALDNTGNPKLSDAQRRIIVLKSAQVLVMYFAVLQPLNEAAGSCDANDVRNLNDLGDEWDQGAALLMGSLQENATNSSHTGYMLYDLAMENCNEFGTCHQDKTEANNVNDQLISLLYSGRGALLTNNCGSVRKILTSFSSLLLIPMIQGALSSAVQLSKSTGRGTSSDSDMYRALGYVYSRALVPLVANADWSSSQTIDNYFGLEEPTSRRETMSKVFAAFATVYVELNVDCELIGTINGYDPCDGVVYEKGPDQVLWVVLGTLLGVCTLCSCVLFVRSRKQTNRLPENNPRFIIPETGELNHSMDLLERAFSSTSRQGMTTTKIPEMTRLTEDLYTDASSGGDDSEEESSSHTTLNVL